MQKARGQAEQKRSNALPPLVGGVSGSSLLPLDVGVLPTVPVAALLGSLSVVIAYLALQDGPRRFRPGFTCPTSTWVPDRI